MVASSQTVLCCKGRPQVATLSGYKLLNPALQSLTTFPSSRALIFCLSVFPAWFLSWILNDPFQMKWMKHNWLSVSGTSVPKLRLELQLQGKRGAISPKWDLSLSGNGTARFPHDPPSPSSRVHLFWEIFNDGANSADMSCTHIGLIQTRRKMGRCVERAGNEFFSSGRCSIWINHDT